MGGAAGHMSHVYESYELTFGDIEDILAFVSNKSIQSIEKIDGCSLFVTWIEGEFRTARNKTDISVGGQCEDDFLKKWDNHPAYDSFVGGFYAVKEALQLVAAKELEKIFESGKKYLSFEIVNPLNPNMISYGKHYIVAHELVDGASGEPASGSFKKLVDAISGTTVDANGTSWFVSGPAVVDSIHPANIDKFCSEMRSFAGPEWRGMSLEEYASSVIFCRGMGLGLSKAKIDQILKSTFGHPEALKVVEIKKGLTKKQQEFVSSFCAKNKKSKSLSKIMEPLELIITDICSEMFSGTQSNFVEDHDCNIKNINQELRTSLVHLRDLASSGDEQASRILEKHLKRLGNLQNSMSTSIEGVVVEFPRDSGEKKKLTGRFAPINQIVGYARRNGLKSKTANKVALVPISAKPYHKGHEYLIKKASAENDEVFVYVSTSDRCRKNEYKIFGKDMQKIWQAQIESSMPNNVFVSYGGSPVRKVYEHIEIAALQKSEKTYTIYTDIPSLDSCYPIDRRKTNMSPLWNEGRVVFAAELAPNEYMRGVGSPNVKGEYVRRALEMKDYDGFASMIPDNLDKKFIWDILTKPQTTKQSTSVFVGGVF
jgi:hypothetical protein